MKRWLLWVLAIALAFGVGGRLGAAISPSKDLIVTGYFAIAASLLATGVLQWLMLRRLIPDAGRWLNASVVSVASIGGLVFGLGLINRDVGWVLGVAAGWLVLGGLQYLVLRGQVAGAGWWVWASMLGLFMAIPVVGFVTWATGAAADTAIGAFLRWLAFGVAYGVVTGTTLSWLRPPGREPATPSLTSED